MKKRGGWTCLERSARGKGGGLRKLTKKREKRKRRKEGGAVIVCIPRKNPSFPRRKGKGNISSLDRKKGKGTGVRKGGGEAESPPSKRKMGGKMAVIFYIHAQKGLQLKYGGRGGLERVREGEVVRLGLKSPRYRRGGGVKKILKRGEEKTTAEGEKSRLVGRGSMLTRLGHNVGREKELGESPKTRRKKLLEKKKRKKRGRKK